MRRRFMIVSGLVAVLTVWGAGAASAATPWTVQATPNPSGVLMPGLDDVSCASATSCIAVGSYSTNDYENAQPLAEHWNGRTWAIQNPSGPVGAYLTGVSCTSTKSCTAVGDYYDSVSKEGLLVAEHWNGRTWSIQAVPNPTGTGAEYPGLDSVSCASARSCTAVGSYFDSVSSESLPLAEHWNGSTWSIQATPNPTGATSNQLEVISCTSATSCTAAGLYNTGSPPGPSFTLAEHS